MSRLTVDAALLYRARVVGALDRAGVRHLDEAVRAGVERAEGLAALLFSARVIGALDQPGFRDRDKAGRAADGVAEQHILPRLSRFDAISAICVACIIRSWQRW